MNKSKLWVLMGLSLFVLVAVAGCAGKQFIRVNGEKVSREEFASRLERFNVKTDTGMRAAGDVVAERLISDMLILQFAKIKGISPTPEQVNKRYEDFGKRSGGNLSELMARSGLAETDLRRQLEVEQAKANLIAGGIEVPEAKIKAAYDALLAAKNSPLKKPEQRSISMLANSSKATVDKAYSMLKSGMDFNAASGKMSDEPNLKSNQGQLGLVATSSTNVPPIVRKLAFATAVGQFTTPFKFGDRWAILKVDQKLPARVMPYEDVKDTLREQLTLKQGAAERGKQLGQEWKEFVSKADIGINAERYKPLIDSIKEQAGQGAMTPAAK